MKKYLFTLTYFILFSLSSFGYEIREIKKMHQALENVGTQTLVVFDIDNTILQAAQTLGSVQWHDARMAELQKIGLSKEESNEIATKEWIQIAMVSKSELVEEETSFYIQDLQRDGIDTVALTARSLPIKEKTLQTLPEFGIHFEDSWGIFTKLLGVPGSGYEKGIIFVGNNSKGGVLKSFLTQNHVSPKAVRFIDDKRKYLESVGEEMDKAGIPFIGYRYGGADERVKNYNPKIAQVQYDTFFKSGILLSDDKAKKLIHK